LQEGEFLLTLLVPPGYGGLVVGGYDNYKKRQKEMITEDKT
jgi:hypothetical protein